MKPILTRKQLKNGLPKAAFYLLLFYVIFLIFGPNYGFVASFTGSAFNFNFQKRLTLREVLVLAGGQIIVCALACLASMNVVLRLTLNAAFPLVWTALRSSPFNNKGYFVGMITFVFLQLIPFEQPDIPKLMVISILATAILVAVLMILQHFRTQKLDFSVIREGLRQIAEHLYSGETDSAGLIALEHTMYKMSYNGHNVMHVFARSEHIYYTFGLIFQRCAYYFADKKNASAAEASPQARKELAAFLSRAALEMNQQDNRSLIHDARELLKKGEHLEFRFGSFYRNILRLFSVALKEMTEKKPYKEPDPVHRYFQDLLNHLKLNAFEYRFALRLAIVMTVSFAVMDIVNTEHSYWMAMNAFVIIQPMYKESTTRVQARLTGSIIGCVVAYVATLFLPGPAWIYAFFSVMITCMYLSTPGKWVQPIFATASGVSMASIVIGSTAAVEYRLLYLGLAALLVFLVNRFIFPSTPEKQFRFNLHELYRMQRYYIRVLETAVRRKVSLTTLHNTLVNFHMLCDEVRKYLNSHPQMLHLYYQQILLLTWRMVAEAEQMIVLIRTEHLTEKERSSVGAFARQAYAILTDRQMPGQETAAPPDVTSVPFFRDLAERYARNLQDVTAMIRQFRQIREEE